MASTKFQFIFRLAVLVILSSIAVVSAGPARAFTGSLSQENSERARRIKPEEVRELLKKHETVLIDVRGEAAYKAGHVKGALNIPAGEILNRAKELPRDKMIATYCS